MKIGRWILLSAFLLTMGKGITDHYQRLLKKELENINKAKEEEIIQKAADYIQNEYKSFYGTKLNKERAEFYAKQIYDSSKKHGVPFDTSFAIANHETYFANRTTDKNLKNGYPPSRGIYAINDLTQEWINDTRKRYGEKIKNIKGKEVLNFPEKNIDDAIWFLAHKKKTKNRKSYAEVLKNDYNPGMGKEYVKKVSEKVEKIHEAGIK